MTVVDPGHEYLLDALDGDAVQRLVFVKREGLKFPGNVGHHSGTTIQEVLRALVERCRYVNNQAPCAETESATRLLEAAILLLELRAARRHGRLLDLPLESVVQGDGKCVKCGHVGCTELQQT
jgi:hypothetical protein